MHATKYTAMTEMLSFEAVSNDINTGLIPFLKDVLDRMISPIYGPQEKALYTILQSVDRRGEVLLSTAEPTTPQAAQPSPVPLGLVVYKLKPTDEFARFGVTNSVEIKTLCLADPSKSSGKGYGSALVNQVIQYAKKNGASGTHVTVSNSKSDSRSFFLKKGFKDLCALPNPHCQAEERLYYLTFPAATEDDKLLAVT